MTNSTPPFEEILRAAVRTPQPSAEFLSSLRNRLAVENPRSVSLIEHVKLILRRPALVTTVVVFLLVVGFFIAGPQSVVTAMRELIGYIPGVGIVDTNTPIRVLAEPVTVEKNGVAIQVISAVLTGNETHIDYQVTGVPESAYPAKNEKLGCIKSDYLRLPDGRQLEYATRAAYLSNPVQMNFLPVPLDIDEAVLVIPCIFNTLPGTVPENWEIPLRFAPAPSDLTVMPVIEVSPSPQPRTVETQTMSSGNNGMVISSELNAVTVNKVIETADGYILLGWVQIPEGESYMPAGAFIIRDASGKVVDHTYPNDINLDLTTENPNDIPWATLIKTSGLVYPLTISFPMVTTYQPDPSAVAELILDVGSNPQVGKEFASNQEFQFLGHTLKLISLKIGSLNGYDFTFQADPEVYGANIEIEGYTSIGVLGGGNEGGKFERSLAFTEIPTGQLKVIVSKLTLFGKSITLQGQWSPVDASK
jgi:hypothetical protein